MKVLIPAAGIGARLGELTNFLPKPLISVGGKPAISYIIDAYPKNTQFVIALGYRGELIREFLGLVYPDHNIEYVEVSPFEGPGSSLLYSMWCAKEHLRYPFILHCADTIVTDPIPPPDFNWDGVHRSGQTAEYRTVLSVGSKLQQIHDKGGAAGDQIHIGLVGVHDYVAFWDAAASLLHSRNDTSLADTDVINAMQQFSVQVFSTWYDVGNMDALHKTIAALGERGLVMLPKIEQATYVFDTDIVKFFHEPLMVEKRVKRAETLYPSVPQVTGSTPHFFKYAKAQGELFGLAFPAELPALLQWCHENLWKCSSSHASIEFQARCHDFYLSKTRSRLLKFYQQTGVIEGSDTINGVPIPHLDILLAEVPWHLLFHGKPTKCFHGDLHFANILKTVDGSYSLIDWREDFGGCLEVGDVYYDLAKLQHGMLVAHDLVDAKQFEVDYADRNNITIDIMRRQRTVECQAVFRAFLDMYGYDKKKVDFLTALIFLNICPLHEYPYNFFLYYLGKKMLHEILSKGGEWNANL
jgi:CTP:phosphocholine cytidylyltransferase-like protein